MMKMIDKSSSLNSISFQNNLKDINNNYAKKSDFSSGSLADYVRKRNNSIKKPSLNQSQIDINQQSKIRSAKLKKQKVRHLIKSIINELESQLQKINKTDLGLQQLILWQKNFDSIYNVLGTKRQSKQYTIELKKQNSKQIEQNINKQSPSMTNIDGVKKLSKQKIQQKLRYPLQKYIGQNQIAKKNMIEENYGKNEKKYQVAQKNLLSVGYFANMKSNLINNTSLQNRNGNQSTILKRYNPKQQLILDKFQLQINEQDHNRKVKAIIQQHKKASSAKINSQTRLSHHFK